MSILGQDGDSMIEVLIAVAIVSLILVSAYVISNKNTQQDQATQERIEAQHLVESQIEALRAQGGILTANDCFQGVTESSVCNNFTRQSSGATYTVHISGPAGLNKPNGIYTINASWTGLGDTTNDASKLTMAYELN